MTRFTVEREGQYAVPEADLPQALQRLAALEDMLEELAAHQTDIPVELARLKAPGKDKTVRYKELLGQKLLLNEMLALLERHGVRLE
ncbi:MAG: hypothetical protein FWC27_02860 [Firmicutes bacterium]|nr:hypothetical protein [Bacillota bacterium]